MTDPLTETVNGVLYESAHALAGSYPQNIPLAEGIDMAALTEGDDNPVFITLPLMPIHAESRNKRTYSRAAVEAVVGAVNNRKIGGIRGHLRDEARAYDYPTQVLQWVGATIEGDMAWGKAYVMRVGDVREMVRVAKATGARLGTSLYGTGEIDADGNVVALNVESIDLVHPDRVGIPAAAAVPFVTAEAYKVDAHPPTPIDIQPKKEKTTMPDDMISLAEAEERVRSAQRANLEQVRELSAKVSEQTHKIADLRRVGEMLSVSEGDDVVTMLRARLTELENLKRENADLLESNVVLQVAERVAVESVRPIVAQLVREKNPVTRNEVAHHLDRVLSMESVKSLLAVEVKQMMGPAQTPAITEPAESKSARNTTLDESSHDVLWIIPEVS